MQVGIVIPQQELGSDPLRIVEWATTVESLGFSFLDVFDHVLGADVRDRPDWPGPYTHEHEFHEPLMLLSHLAAHVDLDLATGVLVLPQRQTALVAKQVAELDVLSGGRVRLGVGIGWNPVEYEALGMRFDDRARRYEAQIRVLRRLWTEPIIDHRDEEHRIDRAGIAPLPVQRPIPIWLGGGHARPVLERIGRLGDGWIIHDPNPGDAMDAALRTMRAAALEAGRDPGSIGLQGRVDIHGRLDVDRFHRALAAWQAAGVTHLALHATGQGGLGAHVELLTTLADLVSDHLDLEGRL